MLPLLESLNLLLDGHRGCLRDWYCIYVQHLLRSNIDCTDFLVGMGLERNNIVIIGKGYSTNSKVLTEYIENGFKALDVDKGYTYLEAFDAQICRNIVKELHAIAERGFKQLLVIDEGGLGIQALAAVLPSCFSRIAVAELTARGAHQYHLLSNHYPIVDVARSKNKKEIEAAFIAQSMVSCLVQLLTASFNADITKLRFGVIGAGAIGSSIIIELRRLGLNIVSWYDEASERSDRESVQEVVAGADIILSSTGKGFDWEPVLREVNRRIIFANCGSSDIEYRLWQLRARLAKHGYEFITDVSGYPWRGNTILRRKQSECIFLRGGFPVNFDGSADPIPPEIIQITRATLMAGAITAVMTEKPGIIEVPEDLQQYLARDFDSVLYNNVWKTS
ncbi:MAG: hypothetical protein KJ914_18770 [Gammaproteobacteria bacterium]|nr:hypothetical protein [Gammaproteobacteria bacterium]MBU1716512.1 hypothetical protein [Pseudomonadota bacterium]